MMKVQTFKIGGYLREHDACHVARKALARSWPEFAHDHDYFEVMLVESGRADHWINGRREKLSPGSLSFIRPGDAHALRADQKSGCKIFNVMFRTETVAHFQKRYPEDFGERFFDSRKEFPETHHLQGPRFERGVNVAQDLANSKLTQARLDEFLLTLANRVVTPVTSFDSKVPRWFAEAFERAKEPAVFRQGAQGFIAAAGRSHEHVCRTCREVLGLTPSALINRVRTEFAADRLAQTSLPISHIAAECGLENISHFYRVFRQHYGTTPRSYRLHHQRSPF